MSHTCIETGVVTEIVDADTLRVSVRRAEACHSCDAKGVCQAFGGKVENMELSVANTLEAEVGDEVTISLLESSVIKASFVLYLLPAVGLVSGALLGAHLLEIWDRDSRALIGAVVGLLAGFVVTRLVGSRMSRDVRYLPRLTKIVSRATPKVTEPPDMS